MNCYLASDRKKERRKKRKVGVDPLFPELEETKTEQEERKEF